MATRELNTPLTDSITHAGVLSGVVLYRRGQFQVQLFILPPFTEIDLHTHPNVDSYEVFVSGDIDFICDGVLHNENSLGSSIRVGPNCVHGGKFGYNGGCFLSIQKWLNDVPPTSVGYDWKDQHNNPRGMAKFSDSF